MTVQRHIIHRQVLELGFATQDEFRQNEDNIRTAWETGILPRLESVLDRYVPPGVNIRLERLEIDLGLMTRENWELELAERVEAEVEKYFREHLPPVFIHEQVSAEMDSLQVWKEHDYISALNPQSPDARRAEAVLWYLRHGVLPWFMTVQEMPDPVTVFHQLELKDFPALLGAMREALSEPAFVQRFVLYAKEEQYNTLLRFTDPAEGSFWEEITTSLKRTIGTATAIQLPEAQKLQAEKEPVRRGGSLLPVPDAEIQVRIRTAVLQGMSLPSLINTPLPQRIRIFFRNLLPAEVFEDAVIPVILWQWMQEITPMTSLPQALRNWIEEQNPRKQEPQRGKEEEGGRFREESRSGLESQFLREEEEPLEEEDEEEEVYYFREQDEVVVSLFRLEDVPPVEEVKTIDADLSPFTETGEEETGDIESARTEEEANEEEFHYLSPAEIQRAEELKRHSTGEENKPKSEDPESSETVSPEELKQHSSTDDPAESREEDIPPQKKEKTRITKPSAEVEKKKPVQPVAMSGPAWNQLSIGEKLAIWKEQITLPVEKPADSRTRFFFREPVPGEGYHVDDAGLVILWPFFKSLFKHLGYLGDKTFASTDLQYRAVHLLHYMATGDPEPVSEIHLVLCKLLCGFSPSDVVPGGILLTEEEHREADAVLQAAIDHWTVLKKTSLTGLRRTFILRAGKVERKDSDWLLSVEKATLDVLMEKLPWGIGVIRLPWRPDLILVEW